MPSRSSARRHRFAFCRRRFPAASRPSAPERPRRGPPGDRARFALRMHLRRLREGGAASVCVGTGYRGKSRSETGPGWAFRLSSAVCLCSGTDLNDRCASRSSGSRTAGPGCRPLKRRPGIGRGSQPAPLDERPIREQNAAQVEIVGPTSDCMLNEQTRIGALGQNVRSGWHCRTPGSIGHGQRPVIVEDHESAHVRSFPDALVGTGRAFRPASGLGCVMVSSGGLSRWSPPHARTFDHAGVSERLEVVLADAGYWHQIQMQRLMGDGLQVLIPPDANKRKGKRPGWHGGLEARQRPDHRLIARPQPLRQPHAVTPPTPVPPPRPPKPTELRNGHHRSRRPRRPVSARRERGGSSVFTGLGLRRRAMRKGLDLVSDSGQAIYAYITEPGTRSAVALALLGSLVATAAAEPATRAP
jgi:hypothetical protein